MHGNYSEKVFIIEDAHGEIRLQDLLGALSAEQQAKLLDWFSVIPTQRNRESELTKVLENPDYIPSQDIVAYTIFTLIEKATQDIREKLERLLGIGADLHVRITTDLETPPTMESALTRPDSVVVYPPTNKLKTA